MSERRHPKLTAHGITRKIVSSLFPWRRYIAVPNVSWGLVPWEMDLAIVSPSMWMDEIEIKTSVADLRKDKEKGKWDHFNQLWKKSVRRYYIAIPWRMEYQIHGLVPEWAGLITIDSRRANIKKEAVTNKDAEKIDDATLLQLLRLAHIRYWSSENAAHDILEQMHAMADTSPDEPVIECTPPPRTEGTR